MSEPTDGSADSAPGRRTTTAQPLPLPARPLGGGHRAHAREADALCRPDRQPRGGRPLDPDAGRRIALARAFFRPAGLLVLDEPTANLNSRAEYRIRQRLRALAQDWAVLLVTHRITSVAIADRIVVLDEGKIVQEGTHAPLSQQPGLFQQLLSYQIMSEPDGDKHETPA